MPTDEYWKKAGVPLSEYMEIDENAMVFPPEIGIAYAVCTRDCGAAEFIVDGSSQICEYCGKQRFRTVVRTYRLIEEQIAPTARVNLGVCGGIVKGVSSGGG